MTAREYANTSFPFTAAIDTSVPQPGRFLAGMVDQQLRYGHPSRRRGGLLLAGIARRGLPRRTVASLLGRFPSAPRPDIDELVAQVAADWRRLSVASRLLPSAVPDLHALAVRRSAALTVFLFGEEAHPLVVLKLPREPDGKVQHETRALELAVTSGVTPRALGWFGDAVAQEGRPGVPPALVPVRPRTAASLAWPDDFDRLTDGLCALARATRSPGQPDEPGSAYDRALAAPGLDDRTRELAAAALRDVTRLGTTVLRHGDLSGQNWLVHHGRLGGIVDWETAIVAGTPGFDAWHSAVSWFEQGVGLAQWSPGRLTASFARAWAGSPFFAGARAAGRRAAEAAGVPADLHESLEVTYFTRRLAQRLARPEAYTVGPAEAAAMLAAVCRG